MTYVPWEEQRQQRMVKQVESIWSLLSQTGLPHALDTIAQEKKKNIDVAKWEVLERVDKSKIFITILSKHNTRGLHQVCVWWPEIHPLFSSYGLSSNSTINPPMIACEMSEGICDCCWDVQMNKLGFSVNKQEWQKDIKKAEYGPRYDVISLIKEEEQECQGEG